MTTYLKSALIGAAMAVMGSGASALTVHPTAACSTADVTGATACIGMVTDTGLNPGKNDSAAAFNLHGFFSMSGWSQADKVGAGQAAGPNGVLGATFAGDLKSGTFSVNPVGGATYALVLKASSGFSAYLLGGNGGNWSTATLLNKGGQQPAISHISLYTTGPVTTVPVPAGILTLGTVLVGLSVFGMRRRKA